MSGSTTAFKQLIQLETRCPGKPSDSRIRIDLIKVGGIQYEFSEPLAR
jgi:hypothetical protein